MILRDWYLRGFKLFWEEELGLRFNCWNNKGVWFLRHRCEETGYYDNKPTDFYLTVTESDSSYENILCDIVSNKQIETRDFYNMNRNSIIGFTKRYTKNEVTLHCIKFDPDFEYRSIFCINPDELPLLIVNDDYLYVEERICRTQVLYT